MSASSLRWRLATTDTLPGVPAHDVAFFDVIGKDRLDVIARQCRGEKDLLVA
jgi:hypothetical protein